LGDPSKAKEKLGWEPQISARDMCAEMVAQDLRNARRQRILMDHGYDLPLMRED